MPELAPTESGNAPLELDPLKNPKKNWMAIVSLVIGIVSILPSIIVPICSFIATIAGIVLGILGLKSQRKTLAIIGIILCILVLIYSTFSPGKFI